MTVRTIESVEDFETTIASGDVVVDFYADWCGPCKALTPLFEEAANTNPDKTFVKVDASAQAELARRYAVRSIPALFRFKDGVIADTVIGSINKAKLEAFVS
jgi:thioredoxin 1